MKTIFKIITIAIISIAMIGTASADTSLENVASAFSIEGGTITDNQINWHSFNIASQAQFDDFGYLHSGAKSNIDTLTIPMPTDSTSIRAWHYEEIEID